jgi:hypothetical protein
MNYEEIEPYIIDYLKGNVEEAMEYRIKAYLQQNPEFQKELDELEEMLGLVQATPLLEPAPQLKMNFYAMLNEAKRAEQKKTQANVWDKILDFFRQRTLTQSLAFASVILLIFLTGYWTSIWFNQNQITKQSESAQEKIAAEESDATAPLARDEKNADTTKSLALEARKEESNKTQWLKELKTTASPAISDADIGLSRTEKEEAKEIISGESFKDEPPAPLMLEKSDNSVAVMPAVVEADERIETIYASLNTVNQEEKIVNALIQALMTDPNPNVRIAAIDALEKFANKDAVKYQIVKTLEYQESPSVQLATIDLIVKYNIKAGAEPLRKLLKQTKLNSKVKEQAQIALQVIS